MEPPTSDKGKNEKKKISCGIGTYSLSSLLGSSNCLGVSFDSLSLLDLRFWSWNTVQAGKKKRRGKKSHVSKKIHGGLAFFSLCPTIFSELI